MIVWVEGADGSGKSTLIKNLVEEYGFTKKDRPEHPSLREQADWNVWWNYCKKCNKPLLVDRGHISEIVYRMNDNNDTYLKAEQIFRHLNGTKIILCETETAFDDAIRRGERLIVDEEFHKNIVEDYRVICKMFNKFFDCKLLTYNWKHDNITKVIRFINN